MTPADIVFSESWNDLCIPRLGLAHLTWQAFQGIDLGPLWDELMDAASDDVAGSGMGMDLAVIAQLRGDKETGLAIQRDTLLLQQLFRPERALESSRLRVLAIAAASDIGANTPIEFLLEGADIDLATYYVVPGIPLPNPMPSHDVAIIVASVECEDALAFADAVSESWPRPILNPPAGIRNLERHRLYHQLQGIPGLGIPATARVSRADLEAVTDANALRRLLADGVFPIIVRPLGSHAGFGLAKIDDDRGLRDYLRQRPEGEFFISRYIDYASADGQFRKYRVAVVGGKPYACHMAIAEEWKVWYLNADMALSVANRVEEAAFMQFFDEEFGARHRDAIAAMADRIGLEYFIVDCAETRDGDLLIFEADNSAIVHDMDPPSVYPYKSAQMRKIFGAFGDMLHRHAVVAKTCAV